MTSVTLTGTGTPLATPGRAGPGVLVRHGDVALQFDAGRGTVLRLAEAGQAMLGLDGLFVTHHHSDHLVGVPDLVMTRWLDDIDRTGRAPLPIYAPRGPAVAILDHMLDVWQEEISMRQRHTRRLHRPVLDVHSFGAGKDSPVEVARVGKVTVQAVAVDHEPVVPAVAYRVDTPDGAVVISGDTAVCGQVEELAAGAALLVHEAIRTEGIATLLSDPAAILAYHAETVALGAMAARCGVRQVALTHLIPPPATEADEEAFAADLRRGGYAGPVIVGRDLTTIEF